MSNIVNLRQFKKRQNRAVKEQTARENRVFYGRTKAEKDKQKLEDKKTEHFFDQHQREITQDKDQSGLSVIVTETEGK